MMYASRVALRNIGRVHKPQRRGLVDYLTKYPDKVMETKKIQMEGGTRLGEVNPTWMKQRGDIAVVMFGFGLVSAGCAQLGLGMYRLAMGVGKKE